MRLAELHLASCRKLYVALVPFEEEPLSDGHAAGFDHPFIAEHDRQRALVDGLSWPAWVRRELGGPAALRSRTAMPANSRRIATG